MIITKLIGILQLLRVRQYYKNLLLLVGIFFSGKIFDIQLYLSIFFAFILVSLSSSIIYIINDIKDMEQDKIDPEKLKNRPLANGTLNIKTAILILILIIGVVTFAIFYYKNLFSIMLILILFNGLLYNFLLKSIAFADIIGLSTMYIWRALAGCAIINVRISPWLTITVFLLALLLATGKRIADLHLLGEDEAIKHKKIYDKYSQELLNTILGIVATSLFMMYTLYCVLGPQEDDSIVPIDNQGLLVFSTPIALFLIIRFIYIIKSKPIIARKSEKLLTDKGLIFGGLILGVIILITLYLEVGSMNFFNI